MLASVQLVDPWLVVAVEVVAAPVGKKIVVRSLSNDKNAA
jgi:hypothetical protein